MSCGPFPHDFGQVQAQIIPYFIKINRVFFFAVVYVTILVFFKDQTQLGRVLKLEKNSQF